MTRLFAPLFVLLARCTRNELARQVQYLKVENSILREKIDGPVRLTDQERARLIKYAQHIPGNILQHLVSIVHYKTVQRWVREAKGHIPSPRSRRGRPPIKTEIVKLIIRLAKETGWGYTRIKGELIKLGHADVGRTTIAKVVKDAGLDPGPDRGPTEWDSFIKRHASTLWAADFLSVKTWTMRGRKDHFILAFIHVGSQQVWLSPCTMHPTRAWVAEQARNFLMYCQFNGLEATHLLRDRDGKFPKIFDHTLRSGGVRVKKLPVRSPNLNAYIERFVQTLKHECLEHFVILGAKHLDYLAGEFVDYYHTRRPHQSMGNQPLLRLADAESAEDGEVVCEERLGGLLKHYYRKAA